MGRGSKPELKVATKKRAQDTQGVYFERTRMFIGEHIATLHHQRAPRRGGMKTSERMHARIEEKHAESLAGYTRVKDNSETDHMARFSAEEALWKAEGNLRHPKERRRDPEGRQSKMEERQRRAQERPGYAEHRQQDAGERQHDKRESKDSIEKGQRMVEHRNRGMEGILREAEDKRREAEDSKREAQVLQREAEMGQRQAEEARMKALRRLGKAEEALARSEGSRHAMALQTMVLQKGLRETFLRMDTLAMEKAGFLGFSEFGVKMNKSLVDEIDTAYIKLSMVKEELEQSKEVIAKGEARIEELLRVNEGLEKQVWTKF